MVTSALVMSWISMNCIPQRPISLTPWPITSSTTSKRPRRARSRRNTWICSLILQLHLLLAEIFARKRSYAGAISELKAYLDLAPHAKDAGQVRELLAELERLNRSAPTGEKPVQN